MFGQQRQAVPWRCRLAVIMFESASRYTSRFHDGTLYCDSSVLPNGESCQIASARHSLQ